MGKCPINGGLMEVNQQSVEDFLSHGSPVVTMALQVLTVMTG